MTFFPKLQSNSRSSLLTFRAKKRLVHEVLGDVFAANSNSEAIWLAAAAKLEWEMGETVWGQVLLQQNQERALSGDVYVKGALLECQEKKYQDALDLITHDIKE